MTNGTQPDAALALDRLTVDPTVARRLPFSLACRYRALPVAEDDGRVTVAMADPGDAEARQAVAAALGGPACLVWSDPLTIELLLGRVWPQEMYPGTPLAAGRADGAAAAGPELPGDAGQSAARLEAELRSAGFPDVALLDSELAVSALDGWLTREAESDISAGPRAVLVRQPARWPAERVLCLMGGDDGDEAAVSWAVRAARLAPASVTLLAAGGEGLPAWLAADTPAGRHLRRTAALLVAAGVEGRLRLRPGPVGEAALREAEAGNYDLLVLPARVAGQAVDGRGPSVAAMLLARLACSLLVTAGPAQPTVVARDA